MLTVEFEKPVRSGPAYFILSFTILIATVVASCSRTTDSEVRRMLSTRYELRWQHSDNILSKRNAHSASLTIHEDGTFVQKCVDEHDGESNVIGQWTQNADWINFSVFYDCVGAWPDTKTIIGASLHFSLGATPVIVVEPDLNVIYVATRKAQ